MATLWTATIHARRMHQCNLWRRISTLHLRHKTFLMKFSKETPWHRQCTRKRIPALLHSCFCITLLPSGTEKVVTTQTSWRLLWMAALAWFLDVSLLVLFGAKYIYTCLFYVTPWVQPLCDYYSPWRRKWVGDPWKRNNKKKRTDDGRGMDGNMEYHWVLGTLKIHIYYASWK